MTKTLSVTGHVYLKYILSGDLEDGTSVNGYTLWISTDAAKGIPTVNITNVPEPGAYALLGSLGLTAAAFLSRRRK